MRTLVESQVVHILQALGQLPRQWPIPEKDPFLFTTHLPEQYQNLRDRQLLWQLCIEGALKREPLTPLWIVPRLAEYYNVSKPSVYNVQAFKTWKEIPRFGCDFDLRYNKIDLDYMYRSRKFLEIQRVDFLCDLYMIVKGLSHHPLFEVFTVSDSTVFAGPKERLPVVKDWGRSALDPASETAQMLAEAEAYVKTRFPELTMDKPGLADYEHPDHCLRFTGLVRDGFIILAPPRVLYKMKKDKVPHAVTLPTFRTLLWMAHHYLLQPPKWRVMGPLFCLQEDCVAPWHQMRMDAEAIKMWRLYTGDFNGLDGKEIEGWLEGPIKLLTWALKSNRGFEFAARTAFGGAHPLLAERIIRALEQKELLPLRIEELRQRL